jgi:hypothetical protein
MRAVQAAGCDHSLDVRCDRRKAALLVAREVAERPVRRIGFDRVAIRRPLGACCDVAQHGQRARDRAAPGKVGRADAQHEHAARGKRDQSLRMRLAACEVTAGEDHVPRRDQPGEIGAHILEQACCEEGRIGRTLAH